RDWGFKAYLLSTGLLYTLIRSPGYYADRGVVGFVGMFVVLRVIAVALSLAGGVWGSRKWGRVR
ncbi:MAG: hypothetical protein KAW09_05225, partial [Thermoplasmata archaeon]|nr:hypothetical protein [Thermoplasmata archaeon]